MPNFFDEADSTGVVEDHIKQVLQLEAEQSDRIIGAYSDAKERLLQRLRRVPQGSFTAQHLRGVLAQVQGALEVMTRQLHADMAGGVQEAAESGVGDMLDELATFDEKFTGAVTPINLNAALVAQDTGALLLTKYKTNLDQYGSNLLTQITNGLFSATLGEASYDEVVGGVGRFFDGEEWKLRRIIRTELHGVYNRGKLDGMKALAEDDIPDLMKTLMHPMDQRTGEDSKYAASLDLVADINEPFRYVWKSQAREFYCPPDRPNDRAVMVPYRREWGKPYGSSFVSARFPQA